MFSSECMIRLFIQLKNTSIFLISPWKHILWYSLKVPYVFMRNNKKYYVDIPLLAWAMLTLNPLKFLSMRLTNQYSSEVQILIHWNGWNPTYPCTVSPHYNDSICLPLKCICYCKDTNTRTKGHSQKLGKRKFPLDIRRFMFSQRVINQQNNLPKNAVSSES